MSMVRPEAAEAADGDAVTVGQIRGFGNPVAIRDCLLNGSYPGALVVDNKTVAAGRGGRAMHAIGLDNTFGAIYGVADGGGGAGVIGESDSGIGARGYSGSGIGVRGFSSSGVDFQAYGTGRIYQYPAVSGVPGGAFGRTYEQIRNNAGEMYIKSSLGWERVATAYPGYATRAGAANFLLNPVRLLDTRAGATVGAYRPGSPYAHNSAHALNVAGAAGTGVPAGAKGIIRQHHRHRRGERRLPDRLPRRRRHPVHQQRQLRARAGRQQRDPGGAVGHRGAGHLRLQLQHHRQHRGHHRHRRLRLLQRFAGKCNAPNRHSTVSPRPLPHLLRRESHHITLRNAVSVGVVA